ncbi:hypothetical protein H9L25_00685 [Terrisporobacter mayombei]|nr:hypothetical protein [Terrisporobacter mayombei]
MNNFKLVMFNKNMEVLKSFNYSSGEMTEDMKDCIKAFSFNHDLNLHIK